MKSKSLLALASLSLAGVLLNCCGNSSSGGGAGITSLASMPKASGPVTTASSLVEAPKRLTDSLAPWKSLEMQLAERAGILVKDWGKQTTPPAYDNWVTGKSAPMCEAGQQIADLFRGATNPDKILCYVGAMDAANLFTNNNYDGNWKYYEVAMPPAMGGGALKVKFKIEMSGGAISNFTMFTCSPEGSGSANDEFISSVLSGTSATLTTVRSYNGGSFSSKDKLVVTGTFDSTGKWLSKQVDSKNYYTMTGGYTGANVNTMIQYSDKVTLEGGFKSVSTGNTFDTQHYVEMGLSGADKYSTLALGAGSGKMNFQNTWLDSNNETQTYTQDAQVRSWTDSGDKTTSSSYLSAVQAKTVSNSSIDPTAVSGQTNFVGDQQWDCQAPSGFTPVVFGLAAQAGIEACDETFAGGSGYSWVPCGYATSSPGGNQGYEDATR